MFQARSLVKFVTVSAAAGFALIAGTASAAGPDMSPLTSAVDASTIVVAIGAVAAIKILPGVARWGYQQVMNLFK